MPNFSGVNFGKIRKAVKFPVEFPVESKSGRIHSKVSGTGGKPGIRSSGRPQRHF